MPCSETSSGLNMYLDDNECLERFEYAKITCSSEIEAETGYSDFCQGKALEEILDLEFAMVASVLTAEGEEEKKFILYLEWDALRCCIVQYLGINNPLIDSSRCLISSIDSYEEGLVVASVLLPPAEMPKITSCSQKAHQNN